MKKYFIDIDEKDNDRMILCNTKLFSLESLFRTLVGLPTSELNKDIMDNFFERYVEASVEKEKCFKEIISKYIGKDAISLCRVNGNKILIRIDLCKIMILSDGGDDICC